MSAVIWILGAASSRIPEWAWALLAFGVFAALLALACQRERKCFPKHRAVRWLVAALLGENNAVNLYGENNAAKQFEDEAKKAGFTVVSYGLEGGNNPLHARMVYPLPNSEQKEGEKKQKCVFLWDELNIGGEAGDHSAGADAGKCVPPVIDLQRGERITHVFVKNSAGKGGAE